MFLPENVLHIIKQLEDLGYEAYVVGGCVRDALMDNIPHDYDITTNATSEQIISIFPNSIPTGLKYGTVTIIINKEQYEITTYRVDGNYSDRRHPDNVVFTKSLKEDLARRDFTINAIAYNPSTGLIDPFNGKEDLEEHIIRCVGDPNKRFEEDYLRILRAVRFSCKYQFDIANSTKEAIRKHVGFVLPIVSAERIQNELNQILLYNTKHEITQRVLLNIIPELQVLDGFEQHNKHHYADVWNHTLDAIRFSEPILEVRLALLLHDIGKPYSYQIADDGQYHYKGHPEKSVELAEPILKRLRYDNKTIKTVLDLIRYHDDTIAPTKRSIKKKLNLLGLEKLELLQKVRYGDAMAHTSEFLPDRLANLKAVNEMIKTVIESQEVFTLKDLAINGKNIMDKFKLKQFPYIGTLLNKALEAVINENVENEKESLLFYLYDYNLKTKEDN